MNDNDDKLAISAPEEESDDFYSDDDLFKISSWGADLSFRELIARYDDNELIKPELQRNYVWDKAEASRFVDSVLLGLPVPSIFLAKTKDEKLLIIDGYQRLMTIRDFVKGLFTKDETVFKLSRSSKVHERWRGKAFVELSPDEQRRIRNTTIHAIIFSQQKPTEGDTSLFQVFERINSSGRTLLPQEIRNCVYQGPMNSLLIDLNKNEKWRALWGHKGADDRMRDMEYVLRFFALSDDRLLKSPGAPSRISLKKYLNQYMDSVNRPGFVDSFRHRFVSSIDFVYDHFGLGAFHNVSASDGDKIVPTFSPTVFDSVLISVDRAIRAGIKAYPTSGLEGHRLNKLRNKEYQKLLYQETMRTQNIRRRIDEMYSALFGAPNE